MPNGLLIMDTPDGGSCVVTSQKFAKGTRFGPLLAQRSYVPVQDIPFPLVLFAAPYSYQGEDEEYSRELQTLFSSGRNIHLDTRNEAKCNWMIHVSLARFSNEQNLICYQVSGSKSRTLSQFSAIHTLERAGFFCRKTTKSTTPP